MDDGITLPLHDDWLMDAKQSAQLCAPNPFTHHLPPDPPLLVPSLVDWGITFNDHTQPHKTTKPSLAPEGDDTDLVPLPEGGTPEEEALIFNDQVSIDDT